MHKWRFKLRDFLCVLLFGYLTFCLSANAAQVQNSQEVSTPVQTASVKSTQASSAQDWSLSAQEWTDYLRLMQGPAGRWYPQLSPPAVLGLNAKTESERHHFAKIVAQQEHDKVARELTFNHDVYLAMRELYPVEPIIQPFDKTPFNPNKGISP